MPRREQFHFVYDSEVEEHVAHLDAKYDRLIREEIILQLTYEPDVATRNRKQLKKPILSARWELRCGPQNRFRVLYNVEEDERRAAFWRLDSK